MPGSELNNLHEHSNTTYQGASDLGMVIDGLNSVWSERPSIRTAFGNRQAFIDANIASLKSLRESTGKEYRELFYSGLFTVVETP